MWENHLLIEVNYTPVDSFSQYQKHLVREALETFPKNKKLLLTEKLFNNSSNSLNLSNEYDKEAFKFYSESKYLKAIESWEKCITLIPNEDSYYLNIAQAYIQIKDFDNALNFLSRIEELNIEQGDGKLEFLKASAYYELKDIEKYCKYFKESSSKGYKLSSEILLKLKCG